MQKGKANIVCDGQWGSTGKGKLAGYLARKHDVDVAACDFMPNAGHTWVDDNGKKVVTCQLPSAVVNDNTSLLLTPGAAIDVKKLLKEIEQHDCSERLIIHPHAAIVEDVDREYEAKVLGSISSTQKGCGGSLARKVMRQAKLAKDSAELKYFIGDTTEVLHGILRKGGTVLLEGAQGFDLSLNHGFHYPYVTSRDVTPMSLLNNAGLPPFYLGDVYGCIRTYPIRVGDMYDGAGNKIGTSGPYYQDQKELTWEDVRAISGAVGPIEERTTVTNKVRRVFTFSWLQMARYINVCAPTKLFINFINHINAEDGGKRIYTELSPRSKLWLGHLDEWLASNYNDLRTVPRPKISFIGTGAKNSDMILV